MAYQGYRSVWDFNKASVFIDAMNSAGRRPPVRCDAEADQRSGEHTALWPAIARAGVLCLVIAGTAGAFFIIGWSA